MRFIRKTRLVGGLSAAVVAFVLAACGGGSNDTTSEGLSAKRMSASQDSPQPAPVLAATWAQMPNPNYAPPAGPYGREWTEMAWDSVRQEIVVWGGNSAGGYNGYLNDIWSYNTGTAVWTQLDANVNCPGNSGFSKPNGSDDSNVKYDPVNNLYWIFGAASGYRCLSAVPVSVAGAGSTTTTLVDPSLLSPVSGTYVNWKVRIGSTDATVAAYDGPSKTLTLASAVPALTAGTSYQLYATFGAGFWYFDPSTGKWTGQNTPSGNTGVTPAARIAAAVAYSDADKAFALYDGYLAGPIDKTVWRLDVQSKLWTQLPLPATTPPHMREMLNSFVYDRKNNVFILFGGICADCPGTGTTFNSQTWAYYLATNTWVNMNPPTAPSPRAEQVMAYDDENGVITLFGGSSYTGTMNDTWYYHFPSNTWTQVAPSTAPVARYLALIAYDPNQKKTVVFGGQCGANECTDIWGLKLTPVANAPTVSLIAPTSGSVYGAPALINLVANASSPTGTIAKVEFYSGATKLGEASSAPYSLSWSNVPAGSYSITARATDNSGVIVTSTAASITVNNPNNQPPTVALSAPVNGSTYAAPATVTLTASASDSDGSVAKVEFFIGSTKIGEASSAPFSMNWTNVAAGSYSITARATDNLGASTTSAAASITVTAAANQPPTVSLISPTNGNTFTEPATITVAASASDPDGSVAKVEFFNGGAKIGEATSAPFSMSWANVAAGSYSVTAVATDNLGATATSSAVNVTVSSTSGSSINVALQSNGGIATASSTISAAYPISSINDGVVQAAAWGSGQGWNDATNGAYPDWAQVTFSGVQAISRVDVYTLPDSLATIPTSTTTFTQYGITAFQIQYWDGANWVTVPGGSITNNNLVWRSVSFPTVSTDRIRILVSNSANPVYSYSRIVEVQAWTAGNGSGVPVNQAPAVALSSPVNGSTYAAPATVTLTASASDSDGSVAKVEFFSGGTKLGETSSAPYNLNWTNVAAGSYSITARATDNLGASTTSAAASITVTAAANQPPTVSLISPTNGNTFTEPATITVAASASDPDGSVAKVEFFNGGAKIGEATSAPFSMSWANVAAGSYSVTAVATDNLGATATSSAVNVTVSSTSGSSINVALQSNGGIATASSTISAAYPISSINDGVVQAAAWGSGQGWNDATNGAYPDWAQVTFSGVQAISRIDVYTLPDSFATIPTSTTTFTQYGITAFQIQYWDGANWVTVPGGSITNNNLVWRSVSFPTISTDRIRVLVSNSLNGYSRIVEVQAWTAGNGSGVPVNQAPAVALSSPVNGSTYAAPATVTLTASASDSDGSVAKVEFFSGGTKLGETSSAPYNLNWTNVAAGSYSITARATDNLGASTTSAAASITVTAAANQPPTVSLISPTNGNTFTEPATITVAASASDPDGSIAKVEFFNGGAKIGEATSAPFSMSWANVAAGSYSVTAVATDNLGATATSSAVNVTVSSTSGSSINVALQSNGGIATASSTISAAYPISSINDGVVQAAAWGSGQGWNDATNGAYPDWAQVTFSGVQAISRIDVYTLPDSFATIPTSTTTFTQYGITAFQIQYWDGANWVTVPGGSITNNNLVWRSVSFPTISTDRIRVLVSNSANPVYSYSRIVEVQAWSSN